MEPHRLEVWTNDGPSVTGRRPVRGALTDPATGEVTPVSSADELRTLLQNTGDGFAIVIAEITDPA